MNDDAEYIHPGSGRLLSASPVIKPATEELDAEETAVCIVPGGSHVCTWKPRAELAETELRHTYEAFDHALQCTEARAERAETLAAKLQSQLSTALTDAALQTAKAVELQEMITEIGPGPFVPLHQYQELEKQNYSARSKAVELQEVIEALREMLQDMQSEQQDGEPW